MRFIKIVLLIGIVAGIYAGGARVVSALHHDQAPRVPISKSQPKLSEAEMTQLQTALNTIIADTAVSTSVSVMHVASGKQTNAGLDTIFRAASTTKVLSVAAYMYQVEQGTTQLDTLIEGTTAQSLIERMLKNSDNNAWYALDNYMGTDNLEGYAAGIGATSFDSLDNTITAADMTAIMTKLYDGKLMNKVHTQLVLSYMQDTNNEDLIPAALPDDAQVWHKFGLYEGRLHDTAVIRYQDVAFALTIFTSNERTMLDDYATRTQLIHQLTQTVLKALPTAVKD